MAAWRDESRSPNLHLHFSPFHWEKSLPSSTSPPQKRSFVARSESQAESRNADGNSHKGGDRGSTDEG